MTSKQPPVEPPPWCGHEWIEGDGRGGAQCRACRTPMRNTGECYVPIGAEPSAEPTEAQDRTQAPPGFSLLEGRPTWVQFDDAVTMRLSSAWAYYDDLVAPYIAERNRAEARVRACEAELAQCNYGYRLQYEALGHYQHMLKVAQDSYAEVSAIQLAQLRDIREAASDVLATRVDSEISDEFDAALERLAKVLEQK